MGGNALLPEYDSSRYSVVQTSRAARRIAYAVLAAVGGLVSWGLVLAAENLEEALIAWLLLGFLIVMGLVLWLARPFLVKDGIVHLLKPVRLASGERRGRINASEIADVSLTTTPRDEVEVWATLEDGTRFRMIVFDEEEDKEWARRFARYFEGRNRHGSGD